MTDKHYPFHCGTQYADWSDSNCGKCAKGGDYRKQSFSAPPSCDLECTLGTALFGDGSVPIEAYDRLFGPITMNRHLEYRWVCGEFEPMDWETAKKAAAWFKGRSLAVPKQIANFAPHMERTDA